MSAPPPPPGIPGGGGATAAAGNNEVTIDVPAGEKWELLSVFMRDSTNVVRCRVFVGEKSGTRSLIMQGIQATTEDYVQDTFPQGLEVIPTQRITFQWVACVLNDVLEYGYLYRVIGQSTQKGFGWFGF